MTEKATQLIITQDKIVDILMHSATREDIAKLDIKIDTKFNDLVSDFKRSNEAMELRISERSESAENRLNLRINEMLTELKRSNEAMELRINERFESMETRINEKIGDLKIDNNAQFLKIDGRYNWVIGTVIGVGVALSGVIFTAIRFFHG